MMMLMMVLRGGRRFSHAAHQRQGAPDPSSTSAAAPSTAPGGGARRHPAALKHPEQPCRHVRFGHTLVPRGQQRVLRPFPPLPPVHPTSLRATQTISICVPADLSSYRPCTMPRYHIYKLSKRGTDRPVPLLSIFQPRNFFSLSLSLFTR